MELEIDQEPQCDIVNIDNSFNKKLLNMNNSYPETKIAHING